MDAGGPTGHAPLDMPKPVAPGLWIVDGGPIRFYGLPFPTRATVVRLAGGGLWVHSPTRLTEGLRAEIAALGPVAHLVAPNWIHYAYLPEWQAAFPEAQSWAAPGVRARAASRGVDLHIDHDLDGVAMPPWSDEIAHLLVEGSRLHSEAVFFHRATRTLILTDLIENFEPRSLPRWVRPLARLAGVLAPDGRMPLDMRLSFRPGRAKLRAAVETMIAWAPERVILAHGRWFEKDGTTELRRAFGFVLDR